MDFYTLFGMDNNGNWEKLIYADAFDSRSDDYEHIVKYLLLTCAVFHGVKTENYDLVRLHRDSWKDEEDFYFNMADVNKNIKKQKGIL